MKILTGALRGRTFLFRPHPGLRPTSDKVKKAVFDMLQGLWEGKAMLDLFSGTGAMGFEALSSGAESATFAESDRVLAKRIRLNIQRLNLQGRGRVVLADALTLIQDFSKSGRRFDIVFVDPPYGTGLGQEAVLCLGEGKILARRGLVVLECPKREEFSPVVGVLKAVKTNVYGDTRILIYENRS